FHKGLTVRGLRPIVGIANEDLDVSGQRRGNFWRTDWRKRNARPEWRHAFLLHAFLGGRIERGPAAMRIAERGDPLAVDVGTRAQIGRGREHVLGALRAGEGPAAVADLFEAARAETVDDQRGIAPGR